MAAARARSMAGAAAALHVTPAAVSLGIAQLERVVHAPLFLRGRRRPLALTAMGRDLFATALAIVSETEELVAKLDDRDDDLSGTLYLGCFPTLAPIVAPTLVTAMSQRHPGVRVELDEAASDDLQRRLLDGTSELALLYGIDLVPGVSGERVAEMHAYVVLPVSHRLATRRSVRLQLLADEPMILLDSPPSRHHALSSLATAGVSPRVERVTHNFETLRSFVARGHGWGLLVQRPAVDVSYEGLPIAAVPIADDLEPVPVVMASAAGTRLSRRARACVEVAHSIFAA